MLVAINFIAISAVAIYIHRFTHNIYLILVVRLLLGLVLLGHYLAYLGLACKAKNSDFGFLIRNCNTFSKFGNLYDIFLGGFIFQMSTMQTFFYITTVIYILFIVIYICLLYLLDHKSI
ncbi:hypothetical protein FSC845_02565 [Francisella persica ATCC VR-331]|nr:hypothetical protein FSC845_02565 [Francisella persica ATCC VR-331]